MNTTNNNPTSMDDPKHLFYLVSKWKWNKIIQKCRSNPSEARLELQACDHRGYTALHWAGCNRAAPVTALREMIRVYPDGLMQESQSGWVPLHVACWRGAYPEVI